MNHPTKFNKEYMIRLISTTIVGLETLKSALKGKTKEYHKGGYISNVKIHGRALSQKEIIDEMRNL